MVLFLKGRGLKCNFSSKNTYTPTVYYYLFMAECERLETSLDVPLRAGLFTATFVLVVYPMLTFPLLLSYFYQDVDAPMLKWLRRWLELLTQASSLVRNDVCVRVSVAKALRTVTGLLLKDGKSHLGKWVCL